MKQVTVTVVDPVGLHARPATVAVNAASKFKSEINVAFKGREVNMKSIMGVMSLGIPTQSEITISCSGEVKVRCSCNRRSIACSKDHCLIKESLIVL